MYENAIAICPYCGKKFKKSYTYPKLQLEVAHFFENQAA